MMRSRIALAVALLAAVAPLGACSHGANEDAQASTGNADALTLPPAQRSRVQSIPVAATAYFMTIHTTGTVAFDADQSTAVLAPISGPVTSIVAQPGAQVAKGQALAYVSSPDFAAAVAGYRKALATYTNARRVADLDEQLFKNDAIARRDLDQAQTDASNAQADVESALGQLRALGVDPQAAMAANAAGQVIQGVIRAPISGTLVEKLITPGQLLQAGTTPCFTIADLSKVWVMGNVFSSDLEHVQVGDRVTVTTSAFPTPFPGTVDYIAALVDPNTKATQVRILVPNPAHELKRDMYVNVAIESRRREQGLLVPVSAVLRDDDNQPFVYVDQGNGTFLRRGIVLGERVADHYSVASGVNAGERVVANGALFLQFAQSQ
ncbi:MAG TPA: efflux RND transporter periplasmic adaptor subunit [Longimicrobiales bacterium]